MEYKFIWTAEIDAGNKSVAEEFIRSTQESGHSPIHFCHNGPAIFTLSSDPMQVRLFGNAKCSCGKHHGIIAGKLDGSDITFDADVERYRLA